MLVSRGDVWINFVGYSRGGVLVSRDERGAMMIPAPNKSAAAFRLETE